MRPYYSLKMIKLIINHEKKTLKVLHITESTEFKHLILLRLEFMTSVMADHFLCPNMLPGTAWSYLSQRVTLFITVTPSCVSVQTFTTVTVYTNGNRDICSGSQQILI